MLAADSSLELGPRRAPAFNAPAHQLSDTMCVQRLKWIIRKYAGLLFINVVRQETPGVIARQSHAHLSQIVGPERKEFRDLGDLATEDRRPRNFDHRAN